MSTIGIEIGSLLRTRRTGMARYTRCLISALLTHHPENLDGWASWRRVLGWPLRPAGIGVKFFHDSPPRRQPKLFHATAGVFPPWKSGLEVATVHDLWAALPEWNLSRDEVQHRTAYIHRADRLICVSEFTRRQLHELLDIPKERSCTIPLAADARFMPASAVEKQRLRSRLQLPGEFFLFVGRDRANKNLERLLQACAQSGLDLPLLIGGSQSKYTRQRLMTLAQQYQYRGGVRWLHALSDQDLPTLISCANVFCMPSTFEGFGLPVIEAMACGTPVLTSAGRATEEVAGGHAVLVDPESVESISDGLRRALQMSDAQRKDALVHATRRSWQDVASETQRVYEEL